MLKIIAGVAAVLAVAIVIVLILAATKPDTFQVTRAATINAPAAKIFPLIADFHQWGQWSPWEHKDPAMQRTFSGANSGLGAVYADRFRSTHVVIHRWFCTTVVLSGSSISPPRRRVQSISTGSSTR